MTEKTSLSDKIIEGEFFIPIKDVKEAVKNLKEKNVWINGNEEEILSIRVKELDELVGDKLI